MSKISTLVQKSKIYIWKSVNAINCTFPFSFFLNNSWGLKISEHISQPIVYIFHQHLTEHSHLQILSYLHSYTEHRHPSPVLQSGTQISFLLSTISRPFFQNKSENQKSTLKLKCPSVLNENGCL